MITSVVSYFMSMLTYFFFEIETLWVIYDDPMNHIQITIGNLIIWYLCVAALFTVLAKIFNNQVKNIGSKKQ